MGTIPREHLFLFREFRRGTFFNPDEAAMF